MTTASGIELVGELDRVEAVLCGARDGQQRLVLDERAERIEEVGVVVDEEDANRYRRLLHGRTLALPS